jgi:hypothetical protein
MGCAASFPADETKFLTAHDKCDLLKNHLGPNLISSSITTLDLMKDWKGAVELNQEYTIKTTDGTDYLKMKMDQEQHFTICDMNGNVLAVLQNEMQNNLIIGCECMQQCKYLYVLAFKPYNPETTVASELTSDDKPLYHWGRVHADPVIVGKPTKFLITLANSKRVTAEKVPHEMDQFSAETYSARFRKDGRFTLKDFRGRGAVSVDFSTNDSESWKVSLCPNADPVFLLCAVMQVQQMVTKLNGDIAYWSSTASGESIAAASEASG